MDDANERRHPAGGPRARAGDRTASLDRTRATSGVARGLGTPTRRSMSCRRSLASRERLRARARRCRPRGYAPSPRVCFVDRRGVWALSSDGSIEPVECRVPRKILDVFLLGLTSSELNCAVLIRWIPLHLNISRLTRHTTFFIRLFPRVRSHHPASFAPFPVTREGAVTKGTLRRGRRPIVLQFVSRETRSRDDVGHRSAHPHDGRRSAGARRHPQPRDGSLRLAHLPRFSLGVSVDPCDRESDRRPASARAGPGVSAPASVLGGTRVLGGD